MLTHHPLWLAPTALLLMCGTASALAQTEDTFKPHIGYSLLSDSNLFRLPTSANLDTLLGKSSAEEQIGVTTVGLSVNKAYSLQRFELDLNLIDYKYKNFDYLNFVAHNYSAAWRWALTPRLIGNFTTDRKEVLNSFADYQDVNQRNLRTNTNTNFDGAYEINGPWRVLAGVSKSAQTNSQPLMSGDDYSETAANTGLRYVFSSGSTLSYTIKKANGEYLNRALSQVNLLDDGFSQTDNELKLHWPVTGKSTVDLTATHINRTHPNFAERDYSGLTAGVNFNWNMTGKSALTAGWVRELASYQTSNSNYAQIDRFTIGPVWQASAKTVVRLRYELAQLNYRGSPSGLATSQRSDTSRDIGLSIAWQPYQRVTFGASLQNAKRSSNLPNFDYVSNIATVSAKYSY